MTTSRIVIAGFLGVALLSSCELAEEGDATTGAERECCLDHDRHCAGLGDR